MTARTHRLTVTPRHADGTLCGHRLTTRGKPRDPESGCTGRADFLGVCACGWQLTNTVKSAIEYAHDLHRRKAQGGGTR